MKNIDIRVDKKYLAIQAGFEWREIPSFAILTGVNGVGKTQLLKMMMEKKGSSFQCVYSDDGTPSPIVLSSSIKEGLSIDGLITYKNRLLDNQANERQNQKFVQIFEENAKNEEKKLCNVTDEVEKQRIIHEIEKNKKMQIIIEI